MTSRHLRRTLVIGCLAAIVFGAPQAARAEDRQLFMLVDGTLDEPMLTFRADRGWTWQEAARNASIKNCTRLGPLKIALGSTTATPRPSPQPAARTD